MIIPYLVGFVLAASTCVYAMVVGMEKDRAFYPTVLIVVAHYYVLFAVMGGGHALLPESLVTVGFVIAASAGFKRSAWIVVAGLAAHGLLDSFHGFVVSNPGVPAYWPPFCMAYDLTLAALLAVRLRRAP